MTVPVGCKLGGGVGPLIKPTVQAVTDGRGSDTEHFSFTATVNRKMGSIPFPGKALQNSLCTRLAVNAVDKCNVIIIRNIIKI